MSCEESRTLLDAYVDGELDVVHSLDIEKHLESCKTCARAVENRQGLGSAFHSGSLYYQPPDSLGPKVDAALHRASPARRINWSMLAAAAALVIVGIFVDRGIPISRHASTDLTAQEVLDSHLRSLQPGHLADVQSSDRHTVKPWFAGKLDFSPTVSDFADRGFPLTGGRLDSIEGRTVAVLVYQRRQHVINVYVWPAAGAADSGVAETTRQGYNILHWTRGGTTWWLASDVNAAELRSLAELLQTQ